MTRKSKVQNDTYLSNKETKTKDSNNAPQKEKQSSPMIENIEILRFRFSHDNLSQTSI